MNKKLILISSLFSISLMFSSIVSAGEIQQLEVINISLTQQTELEIHFIGRMRGGIIPTVGYSIDNIGNEIARNIAATFNIEGGFSGDIYLLDLLVKTELEPGVSVIKSGILTLFGFGPLTITLDVDADNIESIHRTTKGFQIGFCTFIFE